MLSPEAAEAIRAADVILSLDWVDLAGTFKNAGGNVTAKVIQVSVDHHLHNGWSMDYQGLPPVDVFIDCEPDAAVPALLAALGPAARAPVPRSAKAFPKPAGDKLTVDHLADALRRAVGERPTIAHPRLAVVERRDLGRSAIRSTISAPTAAAASAAAPASRSARRWRSRAPAALPVAVCGDGDFLMGVTALWTAAHYRIPLLIVVANNRSFFNDEVHQERVARMRNRRSRTAGSASASPNPTSISPAWRARKAHRASAR